MPLKTSGNAQRPDNAPWESEPHLTETALDLEYPDILGHGEWDHAIAGGSPPGPREFWIAEQFGCRRGGTVRRFAMAMYARKGLGAKPEHYTNIRKMAGHGVFGKNLDQKNVFNQFHVDGRQDSKRTPYGFETEITEHGYYRVIWLEDDSSAVNDPAKISTLDTAYPPATSLDSRKYPLNTIFYGPPGTGKTYRTFERCVEICDGPAARSGDYVRERYRELVAEERVQFIAFHKSYRYEEFVQAPHAHPVDDEGAAAHPRRVTADGILKRMADRARRDQTNPYILIIDEINLADVREIMGELVTILDEDKREGAPNEISITLPYSGETFTMPPNLYILGTMCISYVPSLFERRVAYRSHPLALYRRFIFEELPPDPTKLSSIDGVDLPSVLQTINDRLEWLFDRQYSREGGHRDRLIGHAWFMSANSREDIDFVMRNKIIPLIAAYFNDDWERMKSVLGGGDDFIRRKELSPPPGIDDDDIDDEDESCHSWIVRDEFDADAYQRLVSGSEDAEDDDQ